MPVVGSFADIVVDWEKLLTAVREQNVSDVERYRGALEEHLGRVKGAKDRQATADGLRRRATQELNELLTEGRELAIRLRRACAASLGPKNELLNQFGVAPIRKRTRKAKPTEEPLPGPTPTPDPALRPSPAPTALSE